MDIGKHPGRGLFYSTVYFDAGENKHTDNTVKKKDYGEIASSSTGIMLRLSGFSLAKIITSSFTSQP